MNKHQRTQLKFMADKIDSAFIEKKGQKSTYASSYDTFVSNEDLILANQEPEESEGAMMTMPCLHEVNHFRRLKRTFVKNGPDGVCNYLSKLGLSMNKEIIANSLNG